MACSKKKINTSEKLRAEFINKKFGFAVINNLDEYIKFVDKLLTYRKNKGKHTYYANYIFRGFSSSDGMISKCVKNEIGPKTEFEFLAKFEKNACMKLGQFNNALDLAAAAEHYGIYTRLLDWSRSPYVATLFALYEKGKSEYYLAYREVEKTIILRHFLIDECISKNYEEINRVKNYEFNLSYDNYTLSHKFKNMIECITKLFDARKHLRENIKKCDLDYEKIKNSSNEIILKNLEFIESYFDKIIYCTNIDNKYDEKKKRKLINRFLKDNSNLFFETNFSNERLRNQRGLFELNIKEKLSNRGPIEFICINPNARDEIIKYINRVGFNYYILMDDPENCSTTINNTLKKLLPYDDK